MHIPFQHHRWAPFPLKPFIHRTSTPFLLHLLKGHSVSSPLIQQINRKGATPDSKETKYYAQAKYDGVTAQADIAQMVSQISAISVGDVLSVMNTVSMLLSMELSNGRIVDLGDLGRFRATLRSKSCDKPEEFKREMIHGNRVIFVPGAQIRHKMNYASYLKSDPTDPTESANKPSKPSSEGSNPSKPTPGNETGGGSNQEEGNIGI